MKVNIFMEMAKDGGCSCYMVEDMPDFALSGYGDTPQEAKADMLQAYEEIKQLLADEGKTPAELEFVYHYDMKSFFEYYSMFNVSALGRYLGINDSLMRQYKKGDTPISDTQLEKIEAGIHRLGTELAALRLV